MKAEKQKIRTERSRLATIGSRIFCFSVFLFFCFLTLGCRSAQVAHPVTAELAGNDPDSQIEFWHTLAQRPVTSNDEALHGLLLFVAGEDPATDYTGRVEALHQRQMLPKGFDRPAEEAVQRGTLAVAICRILEIKGGAIMTVFGPSPRYATRELQFMNIYPPSAPHQTFSGSEYLAVIARVEDYQRVLNPVDAESMREEVEAAETEPAEEPVGESNKPEEGAPSEIPAQSP